jgi:hypothetical protein
MAMAALAEGSASTVPSGSIPSSRAESPLRDARLSVFPAGPPRVHRILTTADVGYAPLSPFKGTPTQDVGVDMSFRRYTAADSKDSLDTVPPPPPQAFDIVPVTIDLKQQPMQDVRMIGVPCSKPMALSSRKLSAVQRVRSMSVDTIATDRVKGLVSRSELTPRVQHRLESGKAVAFVGYQYDRNTSQWRPIRVSRKQVSLVNVAVSSVSSVSRPVSRRFKRSASAHQIPALQFTVPELVAKSPSIPSPKQELIAISGSIPSGHSFDGLSEPEQSAKAHDRNARYLRSTESQPPSSDFEFSVESSGAGDNAAASQSSVIEVSVPAQPQPKRPRKPTHRLREANRSQTAVAPHVYHRPSTQHHAPVVATGRPTSPSIELSLNTAKVSPIQAAKASSNVSVPSPLQQRKIVTGFAGTVHPGGSGVPTVASVASLSVVGSPEAGQLSRRSSRVSVSVQSQHSLKATPFVTTPTSLSPTVLSAATSENELLAGETITATGSPLPLRGGKVDHVSPAAPTSLAPMLTSPRSGRGVTVASSLLKKQSMVSAPSTTPEKQGPHQLHPVSEAFYFFMCVLQWELAFTPYVCVMSCVNACAVVVRVSAAARITSEPHQLQPASSDISDHSTPSRQPLENGKSIHCDTVVIRPHPSNVTFPLPIAASASVWP